METIPIQKDSIVIGIVILVIQLSLIYVTVRYVWVLARSSAVQKIIFKIVIIYQQLVSLIKL